MLCRNLGDRLKTEIRYFAAVSCVLFCASVMLPMIVFAGELDPQERLCADWGLAVGTKNFNACVSHLGQAENLFRQSNDPEMYAESRLPDTDTKVELNLAQSDIKKIVEADVSDNSYKIASTETASAPTVQSSPFQIGPVVGFSLFNDMTVINSNLFSATGATAFPDGSQLSGTVSAAFEEVNFSDVYNPPVNLGLEATYEYQRDILLLGIINYEHATSAGTTNIGEITGAGTFTDSRGTVSNVIAGTTIEAEFDDYKNFSIGGGIRYFLSQTPNRRSFIGGTLLYSYIPDIDIKLAVLNGAGTTNGLKYFDDTHTAKIGLHTGHELQIDHDLSISLGASVQYQPELKDDDSDIGVLSNAFNDETERLSLDISAGLHGNFDFVRSAARKNRYLKLQFGTLQGVDSPETRSRERDENGFLSTNYDELSSATYGVAIGSNLSNLVRAEFEWKYNPDLEVVGPYTLNSGSSENLLKQDITANTLLLNTYLHPGGTFCQWRVVCPYVGAGAGIAFLNLSESVDDTSPGGSRSTEPDNAQSFAWQAIVGVEREIYNYLVGGIEVAYFDLGQSDHVASAGSGRRIARLIELDGIVATATLRKHF